MRGNTLKLLLSVDKIKWYIIFNAFIHRFDAVHTTRKVEEFVRKVGGFQMMYADSYMTKTEFRQMFDHTLYDKMRLKFNCEGCFPEVYGKVNKSSRSGTTPPHPTP